jgi:hypothetical protein
MLPGRAAGVTRPRIPTLERQGPHALRTSAAFAWLAPDLLWIGARACEAFLRERKRGAKEES